MVVMMLVKMWRWSHLPQSIQMWMKAVTKLQQRQMAMALNIIFFSRSANIQSDGSDGLADDSAAVRPAVAAAVSRSAAAAPTAVPAAVDGAAAASMDAAAHGHGFGWFWFPPLCCLELNFLSTCLEHSPAAWNVFFYRPVLNIEFFVQSPFFYAPAWN